MGSVFIFLTGNAFLQLPELPLIERIHRSSNRQDRVQVIALPLRAVLVEVAARLRSNESCLQESADAFYCGVFGDPSCGGNGVVAGVADVRLPVFD